MPQVLSRSTEICTAAVTVLEHISKGSSAQVCVAPRGPSPGRPWRAGHEWDTCV